MIEAACEIKDSSAYKLAKFLYCTMFTIEGENNKTRAHR